MKLLMRLTVALLGIGAIALFVGVLLSKTDPDIYKSPLILIPTVALLAVQLLCLVRGKNRKIGFYMAHVAVCLIIISAVTALFTFEDISFDIPANGKWYDSVAKTDGSEVKFGFSISVTDLHIEYYEPEYTAYRYNGAIGAYEQISDTVSCRGGVYRIEGFPDIRSAELETADGYLETYKTADGLMLKRGDQAVKMYGCKLSVKKPEESRTMELAVNTPASYDGWKFYFMDCDTQSQTYATLYVKRDPTNVLMRVGMWLLLLGTAALCAENLLKGRKSHGNA